tara:strand:- start:2349 stop:2477 length:129 start_codon:yes stop_codon:yes gene_type:complete
MKAATNIKITGPELGKGHQGDFAACVGTRRINGRKYIIFVER